MNSPGVIRIEGHLSTNGAGVLMAEREDGKSYGDFIAVNNGKVWLYELPLTDHNIALAQSFWKVRGWKVSVEYFPIVNPFTEEDFAAWKANDDKAQQDEAKKVKALEAELVKLNKALPGLESTFQEEFNKWMAMRGEAEAKREAQPEKTKGMYDADSAVAVAKKTIADTEQRIATLKRGILQ